MTSRRAIFYLLFLAFFSLGTTGQIGTQYSRPANLQLGAKTSVPITAPTINVSLVRVSIVHLISATFTIAVTAPSAFSSELGTAAARVGNFVLGKLPTLNVAITRVFTTLSVTIPISKSIVASAAHLVVNTGSSSLIRLILDIEAPPGTLANLGSTIGAQASVAFIFARIIPIIVRATITAKTASLGQLVRMTLAKSLTINASQASVVITNVIRLTIARAIAATAASVSILKTIIANLTLSIRTFNEPVQFAIGHLTSLTITIAASAENVTRSVTATLSSALVITTTIASVVVTTLKATLAALLTIAAKSATVSTIVKAVKAISLTITAVPSIQLAPLVIFSHIIAAKVTVAATLAQLRTSFQFTSIFQFAVNASRSALAVVFGRAVQAVFRLAAPFGALSIVSSNITVRLLTTISAFRESVGFLFTRLIQDALTISTTSEAVSVAMQFKITINKIINDSQANVNASVTFLLHFIIAATAPHIVATFRAIVGPLLSTIATVHASITVSLHEIVAVSRSITATAESVILAASTTQMKIAIVLTVQVTAAHIASAFHAIVPVLATIVARTTNVTSLRAVATASAHIAASAESLAITLIRGIYATLQIKASTEQVVLSDTIHALIVAVIAASSELIQIILQIKTNAAAAVSAVIDAASALINIVISVFQPTSPIVQTININAPLGPQIVTVNGSF